MPYFAYVRNGTVKYIQHIGGSVPPEQKWIALYRSNVLIKYSSKYDVMPGDLFINEKFYKKDIETGELTLLEDGAWVHPKAVRFAGIINEEIIGQWGLGYENFQDQTEIDQFVEDILNSQVLEIEQEQPFLVQKGWIYNGINFTES